MQKTVILTSFFKVLIDFLWFKSASASRIKTHISKSAIRIKSKHINMFLKSKHINLTREKHVFVKKTKKKTCHSVKFSIEFLWALGWVI